MSKVPNTTMLALITPGTSGLTSEHSNAPPEITFIGAWPSSSIR
jgi:hypothetical protein